MGVHAIGYAGTTRVRTLTFEGATGAITVKLNGIDITDHVYAVRTEIGKDDELGHAQTGVCDLTCNNYDGDFSPENVAGLYFGDMKVGAVIEVYETYIGVRYDKFKGKIDRIVPHAEPENPIAFITALCGMDDMAGTAIDTPLRVATKSGELVDDALDAMGWPVLDRLLDLGADNLPIGWAHTDDCLEFLQSLENMEKGLFYVDEVGKAIWEDRHHRIGLGHITSLHTFDNTMVEFIYEYSKRNLINQVKVTGHVYQVDVVNALVWATPCGTADAPIVPAGGDYVIWVDLDKPLSSYATPIAGTNYDANSAFDKSGVDLSTSVTITSIIAYAQSLMITVHNASGTAAWLVVPDAPPSGAPANSTMLIYGKSYVDAYQNVARDENAPSILAYGKRSKEIDTLFKSNPNSLVGYATYLLDRFKNPFPTPVGVRLNARTDWPDDTIKMQTLTRKISDRITLKSTRLGVNGDFFINKIINDYVLFEAGLVQYVTYYVESVSTEGPFWLLGIAGFSELGTTTVLGF